MSRTTPQSQLGKETLHSGSMKLYIKYMVSLRCKMMVKEELKKLGLHFVTVDLGERRLERLEAHLIVILFIVYIDLAHSFGKSTGFGIGLVFLGIIFFPILGFGDAQYVGPKGA
mgnify:CR=1 FL=1